jgi:hypothetical protein
VSGDEPRYWLFEAEAATPGVDFYVRFLLPAYSSTGNVFWSSHWKWMKRLVTARRGDIMLPTNCGF